MCSKRNQKDLTTPDDCNYSTAGMPAIENCDLFGLVDDCFMAQYLAAGLTNTVEQTSQDSVINKEYERWASL